MAFIWHCSKKILKVRPGCVDKNEKKYLFTSSRLGFRTWCTEDIEQMAQINSDPEVMEFFPLLPSTKDTGDFIERMQQQYLKEGFCYFPVDYLDTNQFIGFTGLSFQNFDVDFTPCIDIGWRISKNYWSKGLATEGALACLKYARNELKLNKIYSMAPKINTRSIQVMKNIGMTFIKDFDHPNLVQYPTLVKCELYAIIL